MKSSLGLVPMFVVAVSTVVPALAQSQTVSPSEEDILVMRRVVSARQSGFTGPETIPAPAPSPEGTPTPSPTPSSTPEPSPDLTPSWSYGSWSSYSTNCGSGTRTRGFECVGLGSSGSKSVMPIEFCDSLPEPLTIEAATVKSGCFFDVGEWTDWSNTCGEGTRTRTVQCSSLNEDIISPVTPSMCSDLGSAPPSIETAIVKSSCVTLANEHFNTNLDGWSNQRATWQSGGVALTGGSAIHLSGFLRQSFTTIPGVSYRITATYRGTGACSRTGVAPFIVSAMNGSTVQSVYYNPIATICSMASPETFTTTFVANTNSTQVEFLLRANSGQTAAARVESITAEIL